MTRTWWRRIQFALTAAFLVFAIWQFRQQWNNPDHQEKLRQVVWQFDWRWILASLAITWVMYALLISGWRLILQGWGEQIGWLEGARIWTVSSLGKYLPGRVWAIAGMAVMAQRAGVSPAAATGSAIVMQILAIASGAMVALALAGPALSRQLHGGAEAALVLAVLALLTTAVLTWPRFMQWLSRLLKRSEPLRTVTPFALLLGLALNIVAWFGYGMAFICFARGTLPQVQLPWAVATGAFAASYLAGYLFFLAPGGLVVRETWLTLLLAGTIGTGPAAALAVASRLPVTINELGAAAPFLLFRRPSRDQS